MGQQNSKNELEKNGTTLNVDHSLERTATEDDSSILLYKAVLGGSEDEALNMLASGATVNLNNQNAKRVLHLACNLMQEKVVNKILENGIDINIRDTAGHTALHILAETVVPAACKSKLELIAVKLLSKGADVNTHNIYGHTPLHGACETGNKDMVKLLLNNGADPNIKDSDGNTPLLALHGSSEDIIYILLENGANVHAKYKDGRTALQYLVDTNTSLHRTSFAALMIWGGSLFTLDENGELYLDKLMDRKRNHMLLKPLVEYIIALECADLDWSKYTIVKSTVKFDNYIPPDLAYLQVENMKKTKCGSFSLYDVFGRHRDPTKLVTDKNVEDSVKSATFKLHYVHYGSLLKAEFMRAQNRYKNMIKAHDKLITELPNEIVWKILTFLENKDLESVTRAVCG